MLEPTPEAALARLRAALRKELDPVTRGHLAKMPYERQVSTLALLVPSAVWAPCRGIGKDATREATVRAAVEGTDILTGL
jgi:hypothetical protein